MATHFEELGGESRLRPLIDTFIDRVMSDVMIGFFFRHVDAARLKELEYQFAAAHLGGGAVYDGRALEVAHRRHPILGGQFNRRLAILRKVLKEASVPEHVAQAWLAHNESLRTSITQDSSSECDPTRAAASAKGIL